MGLPPKPLLPIRLLPSARRTSVLPSGAASLTIHSALLVLVFASSGPGRSAQPVSSVIRQTNVLVFTYIALAPPVQMPNYGSRYRRQDPNAPIPLTTGSEHPLLAGTMSPLEPADLIPTTVTPLTILAVPPRPVAMPSITYTPGTGGPNRHAVRIRDHSLGAGLSEGARRGIAKVAELIGKMGDACPVLRLPRRAGTIAVAVTFVVDTFGTVDRATLRVVERPGQPPEATGFVPHIYTVGATVRVDRNLNGAGAEYGTIVAEDVLRHVAALRFRPGSRNGRPTRSSVLVGLSGGLTPLLTPDS